MTRTITPLLDVGSDTVVPHTRCRNASDAVRAIKSGEVALVPSDKVARSVLYILGLPREDIEDRIRFSYRGDVTLQPGDLDAERPPVSVSEDA